MDIYGFMICYYDFNLVQFSRFPTAHEFPKTLPSLQIWFVWRDTLPETISELTPENQELEDGILSSFWGLAWFSGIKW